jgi:hypothetical protein
LLDFLLDFLAGVAVMAMAAETTEWGIGVLPDQAAATASMIV